MNKKILAAVFSMALLCSCGKENIEELSETGSESVSLASGSASETTVTTTSAETTSEAVSEETEIVTEVSEAEENVPITRDFFNDDVVFEEAMLPVKGTYYENGAVDYVCFYEYDAAGNQCKIQYQYQDKTDNHITENITKYSYRPDGTYSRVSEYYNGEDTPFLTEFYDKHGYCIKNDNGEYEYQFDDAGHLTRKTKTMIDDDRKWWVDYTYDENGRLYEETSYYMVYDEITTQDRGIRHEYDGNIESIYYFSHSFEGKQLWKTLERDKKGNLIKETVNMGYKWGEYKGKTFSEYTYDDMNRVIYENHSVSDDFPLGLFEIGYRKEEYIYSSAYEYDGDKLKKMMNTNYDNIWEYFYDENDRLVKEIHTYNGGGYSVEYVYNDNGSIMSHYYAHGVLANEIEYAMIPKIVTDIEYKNYNKVNP